MGRRKLLFRLEENRKKKRWKRVRKFCRRNFEARSQANLRYFRLRRQVSVPRAAYMFSQLRQWYVTTCHAQEPRPYGGISAKLDYNPVHRSLATAEVDRGELAAAKHLPQLNLPAMNEFLLLTFRQGQNADFRTRTTPFRCQCRNLGR